MSITSIQDVRLNVKPIYIDMSHLYVYEGPCRFGRGEELTYEFDKAMNAEINKTFLRGIRENVPDFVNLMEPVYVCRTDDWRITEEAMDAMAVDHDKVDFYLFADGGRCADVMMEFNRRYPKPCAALSGLQGNTIINATMLSHGCEIYPAYDWDELRSILSAVRVRKMLGELKVLLTARFNANQSMPSAPDSFNHLDDLTAKWGVRFRYINLHELMDQLHEIPCDQNPTTPGRHRLNINADDMALIEDMAKDLIGSASENDMPYDEIITTLKMVRVIQKNMEDEECNAFCAPCPDTCSTRRLNEEHCTMCMAHSLNNELGLPSACEYDITALICAAILSGVSGKAPYISNSVPCNINEEGLVPLLSFLTKDDLAPMRGIPNLMATYHAVPNRKMHGYDSDRSPIALRSFAYSGWAATMRYDFTQDRGEYITQARIDPNCKKMLITRGVIAGGFGYDKQNCTEGLFFTVSDAKKYWHAQQEFGLHNPLVLGDYVDELVAVAKVLGLEPVVCL